MDSVMVSLNCRQDIKAPNVVKLTANKTSYAIFFPRRSTFFCNDALLVNWPIYLCRRCIGISAYKAIVLSKLFILSTCVLERPEKLRQLLALWLGLSISVLNCWRLVHTRSDFLGSVNCVHKVVNNNLSA